MKRFKLLLTAFILVAIIGCEMPTVSTTPSIVSVTIDGTEVVHNGIVAIPKGSATSLDVVITASDIRGGGVLEYQVTDTDVVPTNGWKSEHNISHEFSYNDVIYIWVKNNEGNVSSKFMVTATIAIYVSSSGSDTAAGTEVAPVATIEKAIELLSDGGGIFVMNDITIAAPIEINKAIVLKSSGSAVVLKRGLPTGALLSVAASGNLTLETITIDGQGGVQAGVVAIGKGAGDSSAIGAGKDIKVTPNTLGEGTVEADTALITVATEGNLTLKSGVTVQNNRNTTGNGGGIYNVGTVTINGGTITGNLAIDGGGIYVAEGGTVNLGAGSSINISGNISGKAMAVREDQILGTNVAEKINHGYIPYFSNNIAYTNTDSSPIKVIGDITVASGTKIGLSPKITTANAVLVDGSIVTITASHFSFGTITGGNLTVGEYGTGETGAGGGTVFFCNEMRYEISGSLGRMNWNGAESAIATYNSNNTGGKNDWFFPMIDVLAVADESLIDLSVTFWSSSEFDSNDAWKQSFTNGTQHTGPKDSSLYVCVVRALTM